MRLKGVTMNSEDKLDTYAILNKKDLNIIKIPYDRSILNSLNRKYNDEIIEILIKTLEDKTLVEKTYAKLRDAFEVVFRDGFTKDIICYIMNNNNTKSDYYIKKLQKNTKAGWYIFYEDEDKVEYTIEMKLNVNEIKTSLGDCIKVVGEVCIKREDMIDRLKITVDSISKTFTIVKMVDQKHQTAHEDQKVVIKELNDYRMQ
jgi:hypothetical protein